MQAYHENFNTNDIANKIATNGFGLWSKTTSWQGRLWLFGFDMVFTNAYSMFRYDSRRRTDVKGIQCRSGFTQLLAQTMIEWSRSIQHPVPNSQLRQLALP